MYWRDLVRYLTQTKEVSESVRDELRDFGEEIGNTVGITTSFLMKERCLKIWTRKDIQAFNEGIEDLSERLFNLQISLKSLTAKEGTINLEIIDDLQGLIDDLTPRRIEKIGEHAKPPTLIPNGQLTLKPQEK